MRDEDVIRTEIERLSDLRAEYLRGGIPKIMPMVSVEGRIGALLWVLKEQESTTPNF